MMRLKELFVNFSNLFNLLLSRVGVDMRIRVRVNDGAISIFCDKSILKIRDKAIMLDIFKVNISARVRSIASNYPN